MISFCCFCFICFGCEQIKHINQAVDLGINLFCADDNLDLGKDLGKDDFGINFFCADDNLHLGEYKHGHCCFCFFRCCSCGGSEDSRTNNR